MYLELLRGAPRLPLFGGVVQLPLSLRLAVLLFLLNGVERTERRKYDQK